MDNFQFEVIAVRHEGGEHSKIVLYKVKSLSPLGSPVIIEMERMNLMIRLQAKINIGVRENPSDKTLIPVLLENINHHQYVKTVANGVAEDNLGNLPEF